LFNPWSEEGRKKNLRRCRDDARKTQGLFAVFSGCYPFSFYEEQRRTIQAPFFHLFCMSSDSVGMVVLLSLFFPKR